MRNVWKNGKNLWDDMGSDRDGSSNMEMESDGVIFWERLISTEERTPYLSFTVSMFSVNFNVVSTWKINFPLLFLHFFFGDQPPFTSA